MQREKGKRFERKIADDLRLAFPNATVHRSSQADRAYHPDVVIEGDACDLVKRLWLELTDSKAPDVGGKLAQAERDCIPFGPDSKLQPVRFPVVVWHVTGKQTVYASMRLHVLAFIFDHDGALPSQTVVTVEWPDLLSRLVALDKYGLDRISP